MRKALRKQRKARKEPQYCSVEGIGGFKLFKFQEISSTSHGSFFRSRRAVWKPTDLVLARMADTVYIFAIARPGDRRAISRSAPRSAPRIAPRIAPRSAIGIIRKRLQPAPCFSSTVLADSSASGEIIYCLLHREGYAIYALDLLGFGFSQKAKAPYTVKLLAELVCDFWETWIGIPTAIVGHSLGSLVALVATTLRPEMAKTLVFLTLPDAPTRQPPAWARAIENFVASAPLLWPLFRFVRQRWLLRWVLQRIYQHPERVDEELVDLYALPPRDRDAFVAFRALARSQNNPEGFSASISELLPQAIAPVLLLWGDRDRIVPLGDPKRFSRLNPNVRLILVTGAGHCLFDEMPDRIERENRPLVAIFRREDFANFRGFGKEKRLKISAETLELESSKVPDRRSQSKKDGLGKNACKPLTFL